MWITCEIGTTTCGSHVILLHVDHMWNNHMWFTCDITTCGSHVILVVPISHVNHMWFSTCGFFVRDITTNWHCIIDTVNMVIYYSFAFFFQLYIQTFPEPIGMKRYIVVALFPFISPRRISIHMQMVYIYIYIYIISLSKWLVTAKIYINTYLINEKHSSILSFCVSMCS